jgi:hypothetical protein
MTLTGIMLAGYPRMISAESIALRLQTRDDPQIRGQYT